MVESISSSKGATSAPARDVRRVRRRPGWVSFSDRMAGEVIRTSPSESSRMHRMLPAPFQSGSKLIGVGFSIAVVAGHLVDEDIADLLDDARGRVLRQVR